MGFLAAKTVLALVRPPSGLLLLLMSGLLLERRRRAVGRTLLVLGVVLFYLLSLPVAADLLIRPLEATYPPFAGSDGPIDAVVVLGGGVHDLSRVHAGPALSGTSLLRLVSGIKIARGKGVPLILSGGNGEIVPSSVLEADVMADTAIKLGFPRNRIRIEDRSHNTLESAHNVAGTIPGATIVLVTSAFHMKRAAGMFRKGGLTVIPAPADYHADSRPASWSNLIPSSTALSVSSTAIAERLSLLWYGVHHQI